MEVLVRAEWLNNNLQNKDLIILDGSLKKTASGNEEEQEDVRIPGARYFDLKNKFSKLESAFPNTIPSPNQFEAECRVLGINKDSKIVVYDNKGIYSSPRIWWLFKVMGHKNVSVLDGGLPHWIKSGYETEPITTLEYPLGSFSASFESQYIKFFEQIETNIQTQDFLVVDARSEGRFKGVDPEPRKHLKSGCILNSINIPFTSVLEQGKFKPVKELKKVLHQLDKLSKPIVFSCGSGLTACIVLLATEITFNESRYVYDGSWTEWAEMQKLFAQ